LALVTCVFAAITVALTYPQITVLGSKMGWHYDTLFSVWRLAWIAHQLPRDPIHLFDANIFHPEKGTLAYSDALLLPGLLGAPFIWLGVHPIVVHNLLVLISFVASGVAMYVLIRHLTGSAPASWCGAAIYAFQAYRFAHFPQLELLWGWWIPLTFWAFHRMLRSRRVRDGTLAGFFMALQAVSCLYYIIFLLTALAILGTVWLVGRPLRDLAAAVKPTIAALAVFAVLAVPYLLPYVSSSKTVGTRREQDIQDWSPTLIHYAATTPANWIYGRFTGGLGHMEATMFPGAIALALAVVGVWPPFSRRRLAYAVLTIVAFDMSLGFNGLTYRLAYSFMWPYQGLRVPARMFVVVSAALAVLSAEGFVRIWRTARSSGLRTAMGVALTAGVLLESAATPIALEPVEATPPRIYAWLRRQPRGVVMEWPLPRAHSLGFTHEPLYMYYSTFHWQPLVNGYSGYYPPSFVRLAETVPDFPAPEVVRYLQARGVRYVILHSEFTPEAYIGVRKQLARISDFRLLVEERDNLGELAVYQLNAPVQTER
jgi:hypothetical protein